VNGIGIAQGVYYLVTALWPFFSLRTFIAVTGPKTDVLVSEDGWSSIVGDRDCVDGWARRVNKATRTHRSIEELKRIVLKHGYTRQKVASKIKVSVPCIN
jgi:hypothetical protein